jgi:hypothetical protein
MKTLNQSSHADPRPIEKPGGSLYKEDRELRHKLAQQGNPGKNPPRADR